MASSNEIDDIAGRVVQAGLSLDSLEHAGNSVDVSDTSDATLLQAYQPDLIDSVVPDTYDGSIPLSDSKWEAFCSAVALGSPLGKAYRDHVSSKASMATARQQASRGCRRPQVQARLTWLRKRHIQAVRSGLQGFDASPGAGAQDAPERGPDGRLDGMKAGSLTPGHVLAMVEQTMMDTAVSGAEKLRAADLWAKLQERLKPPSEGKRLMEIDPVDLAEYHRMAQEQGIPVPGLDAEGDQAAGQDPVDIVSQKAKDTQDVGGDAK